MSKRESRSLSFKRLFAARTILGADFMSLQTCHDFHQFDKLFTEYSLTAKNYARYHNLQTCQSVWICPICSQRVSKQRREILSRIVQEERQLGHSMALLTYTTSHYASDSYTTIRDRITEAHRLTREGRQWATLSDHLRFEGSITTTEVTAGRNGFHVHKHELVSLDQRLTKGNVEEIFKPLETQYLLALDRAGGSGLDGIAFQADCAYDSVHAYAIKWGIVPELLGSSAKKARGENLLPFQMLDLAYKSGNDMRLIQRRFREYAFGSKGQRQCVPSVSWRSRMKNLEQEIKAEPYQRIVIDDPTWNEIKRFRLHNDFLEFVEGESLTN